MFTEWIKVVALPKHLLPLALDHLCTPMVLQEGYALQFYAFLTYLVHAGVKTEKAHIR